MIAQIEINNNFQKSDMTYRDLLSEDVIKDICFKVTGQYKYKVTFNKKLNVGRLVIIKYNDRINYITLSEIDFKKGRNSAMQSSASALTQYYLDSHKNKCIYFYFLRYTGNAVTEYLTFMYRLLMTAGLVFLNDKEKIGRSIKPFNSLNDIIISRGYLKKRQNFSSYITKNAKQEIEVYAKTYGANKKEATILCIAMARIDNSSITVYQVKEHGLSHLPKPDKKVMEKLKVNLIEIDKELTRENDNDKTLRSNLFTYNLLRVRGAKKCAWCNCDIPEIIEGAHIWPIAQIKKENTITKEKQRVAAVDGNNGIWLCRNHHKLFDSGIVTIDTNKLRLQLSSSYKQNSYIKSSIKYMDSSDYIDNDDSLYYLERRYN